MRISDWSSDVCSSDLGHGLALVSVDADCDGDTLLVQARPQGPTCHLGRASCFAKAPMAALARLAAVIAQRDRARPAGSYTTGLFALGVHTLAKKVGAEGVGTELDGVRSEERRVGKEGVRTC